MLLQNYQNFTEMTSNMIYIVAFGVGLKCPGKNPFEHTVVVGGGGGACNPPCLTASDLPERMSRNKFFL